MELTKHQRAIMGHTISDPNRNWFGTSLGNEDSEAFEQLVSGGLATKETPPKWMGDDVIYRLTASGKQALNTEQASERDCSDNALATPDP